MRRSTALGALAVAGIAVAGITVAGITTATAQAGTVPTTHPAPVTRFTVVEHADTDTVVHTGGRTGDQLGNLLAFGNPVYGADDRRQVGRDHGSCVRTQVGVAWECSWTTVLDGGSLVVEGPFYDRSDSVLAITGGTGRWSGARGEMTLHARDAAGTSYDFSFAVAG